MKSMFKMDLLRPPMRRLFTDKFVKRDMEFRSLTLKQIKQLGYKPVFRDVKLIADTWYGGGLFTLMARSSYSDINDFIHEHFKQDQ